LKEGREAFGWHGAVMVEQPPFSFRSAFRQRYRWVLGTLQGLAMMQRRPEFRLLPAHTRFQLVWSTRYRVATFALGSPTGLIGLGYVWYLAWLVLSGKPFLPLPVPVMVWLVIVGFLWLNSLFIGAFYNTVFMDSLSPRERWIEVARVIALAPVAGTLESSAAFCAALNWMIGRRQVSWQPTPKTKEADKAVVWDMAG
jgi:hypothetical protein